MYKINNIEKRNLEEQVQQNKEDIARHYAIDRAMSNLGIEVVGQVATPELLPDPLTYTGKYGDTYAVGSKPAVDAGEATYDYYVYTRPDPNSGEINNYWLNVGKISIAGPIGPEGPQGEQGPEGKATKWFYGDDLYTVADEGDFLLTSAGLVYEYIGDQWVYKTNIKGPQGPQGVQGQQGPRGEVGPQGPKGDTGDAGGFINIRAILTSTDELPLPSTLDDRTVAYLVGATEPYDLYIQIGESSDTAVWSNQGPLNVATLVTVNGEYQNTWNADTKLNKDTTTGKSLAYTNHNGQTLMRQIESAITFDVGAAFVGRIPTYRDPYSVGQSNLTTGTPGGDFSCTNKKYVDDVAATKVNQLEFTSGNFLYSREGGMDKYRYMISQINDDSGVKYLGGVPIYQNIGGIGTCQLTTGAPGGDFSCVNLRYFNENKGTQLYKHQINFSIAYGDEYTQDSSEFTVTFLSTQSTAVTGINNNTWFNAPANGVIVESESEYAFHKDVYRLTFETINNNSFNSAKWEMWRDFQEGWPADGGTYNTISMTFISDTVTSI